jgi:hypothetical protein
MVKMNRKLGLFIVFSFFAMQVLSTLHMAEYGVEKHEHNGHICQIYLHCEHTKYSTPGAAIALYSPEYVSFTIVLPELLFVRSESYGVASPRAPPLFS